MSIKEKPLIDAVEKLGPLPGFLFASMFAAGFFAIVMVAVFGVVFMLFQVGGRGFVDPLLLYETARVGAYFAVAFGAAILIGISINASHLAKEEPEDARGRHMFVHGGFAAAAFMIAADLLALEWLRAYFAEAGPLR